MLTRRLITTAAVLSLSALLGVVGCQSAPPTTPAPSAASPAAQERVLLLSGDAEVDAAELVAQDETVYLVAGAAGHVWTVPITYTRGVEEGVEWLGAGPGTATLLNAYGQQVYQVREGGPRIQSAVPAGQYRLVLSGVGPSPLGATTQLLLEVSATGAAQLERVIRPGDEDEVPTRGMDRRPRVPCPAVADELAELDARIAAASGELAKLSRLRAGVKPIVTMQGQGARPYNINEFVALVKYFGLTEGGVPSYFYSEIDRLRKTLSGVFFGAQRERRTVIDAHCP